MNTIPTSRQRVRLVGETPPGPRSSVLLGLEKATRATLRRRHGDSCQEDERWLAFNLFSDRYFVLTQDAPGVVWLRLRIKELDRSGPLGTGTELPPASPQPAMLTFPSSHDTRKPNVSHLNALISKVLPTSSWLHTAHDYAQTPRHVQGRATSSPVGKPLLDK